MTVTMTPVHVYKADVLPSHTCPATGLPALGCGPGCLTDGENTSPQVRLVEEETSYCSYGEAYEVNCARYGREADQPISHFKKRCCSPNGNLISDPDGTLRLQVCSGACLWPHHLTAYTVIFLVAAALSIVM